MPNGITSGVAYRQCDPYEFVVASRVLCGQHWHSGEEDVGLSIQPEQWRSSRSRRQYD